jgi:alkylation response protein AidB-like acyl-CoA dehydrogenase
MPVATLAVGVAATAANSAGAASSALVMTLPRSKNHKHHLKRLAHPQPFHRLEVMRLYNNVAELRHFRGMSRHGRLADSSS